jgi:uncharacterized membrane protein (DUF485 family)
MMQPDQSRKTPAEAASYHAPEATMVKFLLWLILFILCWPVALIALVAFPFVWLILLPFKLVGIAVGGVLAFLKALLFLPARLLGGRPV